MDSRDDKAAHIADYILQCSVTTEPAYRVALKAGTCFDNETDLGGLNKDGLTTVIASALRSLESAEPVELARRFHEAYERLAPTFGYETREDTREFDPDSRNGKLMVAVCSELAGVVPQPAKESAEPVYLFRRRGLDDFCTCDRERYDELSNKPGLFEVKVLYEAPQPAKAQVPEWRPMEAAPKGDPGTDAGSRQASEWFLGRIAPQYRHPGSPPFLVIQRRGSPHEDSWACYGDCLYVSDYFDAWRPLTAAPNPPQETGAARATNDITCECGSQPRETYSVEDDAGVSAWKLADRCSDCLESNPPQEGWLPMETAPKDGTPIVALCRHDADPYWESEEPRSRLTPYGTHAEAAGHVEDGPHVVVWEDGERDYDEYSGEPIYWPGWWFQAGSYSETAANPVGWAPLPHPPQED